MPHSIEKVRIQSGTRVNYRAMGVVGSESDGWQRMVLRSLPLPAWLSGDAPQIDVVLRSRARFMRNLAGYRFPHTASLKELMEVMAHVLGAAKSANLALNPEKGLTMAERDHLVNSRLISPDFQWQEPGRALLLDTARAASVMINEEDHLRAQALTAGWSIANAEGLANHVLEGLRSELTFAHDPQFGHLSASPYNAGEGRRISSMLHLIGLASNKRLPEVLKALNVKGITARGLFGESSRAVGAFLQVSIISSARAEFVGAIEYLIREERKARLEGQGGLSDRVANALDFAQGARTLSLAETLRLLGWLRWAACAELAIAPKSPREVDYFLTTVDLRSDDLGQERSVERAVNLRKMLGL